MYTIPQYIIGYHSISQYTTVYHSVPQDTTVYHSVPQDTTVYLQYIIVNYTGAHMYFIWGSWGYLKSNILSDAQL